MNVTLKIDDELCRAARHRAVDEGLSLSGFIAEVLKRELGEPLAAARPTTLLEILGNDITASVEIDFPRAQGTSRAVDLS